jgi:Domain of unknown function (DUF1707)
MGAALPGSLADPGVEIYLGCVGTSPPSGTEEQMAPEWNVRVSDTEREAVAAQLREHYAQGRLSLDELNERLDRAFASRTRADLDAVTSDLPYTAPWRVLPSDRSRRAGYGPGGSGSQSWIRQDWGGPYWSGPGQIGHGCGSGYGYGRRRSAAGFIPVMLALWVCFAVLSVFAFGVASGPSVIAILLAAVAALRWLFGLRRRGPIRGGRGGRRW